MRKHLAIYFIIGTKEKTGDMVAAEFAIRNGGETLEMVLERTGRTPPDYDRNNASTITAWEDASREFAKNASGHVRVLQGEQLRNTSVWGRIEYPALIANERVKSIRSINISTGEEVLLWSR